MKIHVKTLQSSWTMTNRVGKHNLQKAREVTGRPNREQSAINSEIAGDRNWERNPRAQDMDKARINRECKRQVFARLADDIRARFGPRLVRKDGTALYQFQCK
jgi:hypothetical protein